MNESVTFSMILDGIAKDTVMSNVCLVCGAYENPKADYGDLSVPWLCGRCRRKLMAFVESEETE